MPCTTSQGQELAERLDAFRSIICPDLLAFNGGLMVSNQGLVVIYEEALVSVRHVIESKDIDGLDDELILDIALHVATAMLDLHSTGKAHGGLTIDHLWLTKNKECRVSGYVRMEDVQLSEFSAPELILESPDIDLKKADVFSFGMALIAMIAWGSPVKELTSETESDTILEELNQHYRLEPLKLADDLLMNCICSSHLRQIVYNTVCFHPNDRWSFGQIVHELRDTVKQKVTVKELYAKEDNKGNPLETKLDDLKYMMTRLIEMNEED
eukprot:TRINITY_DN3948_c2_g1_i3.p2 TRINITY_DN3948_c2_g1~~TRINITY_DN3948_c2_g1_i3.p2  ORF type:complete len:269 (-),score=68.11 TRINITY_DN3948_c2_g1_i3:149-955(-)